MTITLFALPYDISEYSFYFPSAEEYVAEVQALQNSYGDLIEVLQIQFIGRDTINFDPYRTIGIN